MQLSKRVKIDRVSAAVAAGTTDITGDTVDMSGFEGVLFLVHFGAITAGAVTSIKVQQGAASDMSDAADLAGTAVTVADSDDGKIVYVDVLKPTERYVRCIVDRATQNAVVDTIEAILYGASKMPTTHAADVKGETHASPAEGTA